MMHLRLQSPTQRRALLVDDDEEDLGTIAAVLREGMGFPDDWATNDAYDCAVSFEPVHEDYWRTLTEVQVELRMARARAASFEDQLRVANLANAELMGRG